MLIRPAAVSAFVQAFRRSMSLSRDDVVSIRSVQVVAPSGRRLDSGGKWQVRFQVTLNLAGVAHAKAVSKKVDALRHDSGGSQFVVTLAEELVKRSMVVRMSGMTASLLSDQQAAAALAAPAPAPRGPVDGSGAGTGHAPAPVVVKKAEESDNTGMVLAIVGICVLLCVCLPACSMAAMMLYRKGVAGLAQQQAVEARLQRQSEHRHHRSSEKHEKRTSRTSRSSSGSVSYHRDIAAQRRTQALEDAAAEGHVMPSPGATKVAWPPPGSDARADTPPSRCSTATGGSGSNESMAVPVAGSARSAESSRRASSRISSAPSSSAAIADSSRSSLKATATTQDDDFAAQPSNLPGQGHSSGSDHGAVGRSGQQLVRCEADDGLDVESVHSAAAATSSNASPLRFAALREAHQPPLPQGPPPSSTSRVPDAPRPPASAQSSSQTTRRSGDGSRSAGSAKRSSAVGSRSDAEFLS